MKAAFFDVDGTLTRTNIWGGLIEYFRRRGERQVTHLVFQVYHYTLYFLHRLGLLSEVRFRTPWAAHLGWYFRGYPVEEARKIWDWVLLEFVNLNWREDVVDILQQHLREGDLVMLVSGGPAPLLSRFAEELGVDHVVGTLFEVNDGRYTGRIAGPVCQAEYKAKMVRAYLSAQGIEVDWMSSRAYADSMSDLDLFAMVGYPVAVYPDERLRQLARERNWRIYPD